MRAAVRQVRNVLHELSSPKLISDDKTQQLKRDLAVSLEAAGEKLSASERRKARAWIGRPPRPAAQAPGGFSSLTAGSLRSAVTSVRGVLENAAGEQKTTS